MYRRLDGTRIVETLERLRHRIGERFPGSGLERVSGDLLDAASESMARVTDLRRPNVPLRIATWALIAIIVFVAAEALLHLRLAFRWEEFAGFLQSSQAIQNVVFLGLAVLFLANVETRIKRRRALAALHELRSIAHIVDMHQLTKDPDQFLAQGTMTRFELSRYLCHGAGGFRRPGTRGVIITSQRAVQPPSMRSVVPVTRAAAGEAR